MMLAEVTRACGEIISKAPRRLGEDTASAGTLLDGALLSVSVVSLAIST